mmetsp:Transcript_6546/g.15920  ORF Transcript_6546/g.15920 Transcript_6546/m.15920 type:complete len:405 (-) Transcript_6546:422-1636(-)
MCVSVTRWVDSWMLGEKRHVCGIAQTIVVLLLFLLVEMVWCLTNIEFNLVERRPWKQDDVVYKATQHYLYSLLGFATTLRWHGRSLLARSRLLLVVDSGPFGRLSRHLFGVFKGSLGGILGRTQKILEFFLVAIAIADFSFFFRSIRGFLFRFAIVLLFLLSGLHHVGKLVLRCLELGKEGDHEFLNLLLGFGAAVLGRRFQPGRKIVHVLFHSLKGFLVVWIDFCQFRRRNIGFRSGLVCFGFLVLFKDLPLGLVQNIGNGSLLDLDKSRLEIGGKSRNAGPHVVHSFFCGFFVIVLVLLVKGRLSSQLQVLDVCIKGLAGIQTGILCIFDPGSDIVNSKLFQIRQHPNGVFGNGNFSVLGIFGELWNVLLGHEQKSSPGVDALEFQGFYHFVGLFGPGVEIK